MNQIIFTCPFCQQSFYVAEIMEGQVSVCPNCKNNVVITNVENASKNTTSFSLGVVSLCTCIFFPIISLVAGIIGLIFGIKKNYHKGIVLNAIGLSIAFTVLAIEGIIMDRMG